MSSDKRDFVKMYLKYIFYMTNFIDDNGYLSV